MTAQAKHTSPREGLPQRAFRSFLRFPTKRRTARVLILLASLRAYAVSPPKVDQVLILKRKHKLELLSGSEIVKSYSISLGRGGLSPKLREGDRRTPEGTYRIDARNPASQYHLSLHISYPNDEDKERARKLGVSPGSDIMIHGLGKDFAWMGAKRRRHDWTDGCIAVTDREIEEIWRMVSDGTPVTIRH
jgi:murein L,D-transpeptidase YafK